VNDALLTDDQRQFRQAVRVFVEREIAPHATRWDLAETYPLELFPQLGRLGWLGTAFPEGVGGAGGGAVHYALMCAELARGSAAVALGIYVHTALAAAALLHLGDEAQQRRFLAPMLRGEKIGCWAYAEAGAGADVSTVATRARREGEEYVLDGAKLYITNAPFADVMVMVAASAPGQGMKGLSLFIVERGTPGLAVGTPLRKLGMGASPMAEIVFDGCRVPTANRLGAENQGFLQALKVLSLGRVASAAFGVGLGQAALDAATAYARERVQFGQAIAKHQFVRFTLAEIATRLEAAWQLTLYAARLIDASAPFDREASMAKLFASETCTWACERALHLSGAQGYMRESPVQRFYRDCKVLELGEGTSEVQREMIARSLGI